MFHLYEGKLIFFVTNSIFCRPSGHKSSVVSGAQTEARVRVWSEGRTTGPGTLLQDRVILGSQGQRSEPGSQ